MSFNKEALTKNIRDRVNALTRSPMTFGELAERADVSTGALRKYMSGEFTPSADKLMTLSEALGCTPNDLLGVK